MLFQLSVFVCFEIFIQIIDKYICIILLLLYWLSNKLYGLSVAKSLGFTYILCIFIPRCFIILKKIRFIMSSLATPVSQELAGDQFILIIYNVRER